MERGLGTVHSTRDCCIKIVQGNKFASANAFPPWLVSSAVTHLWAAAFQPEAFFLPTSLKKNQLVQYSISTCHGQPVVLAAGFYFTLTSQAFQQGSNPGNLTVRRLVLPHEERALWPGFQPHVRGVPCLPGYFGARKGRKFKEPCAPSSCKNVGCSSLSVRANSLLSSSTQMLAYCQPTKARKAGSNCLLST